MPYKVLGFTPPPQPHFIFLGNTVVSRVMRFNNDWPLVWKCFSIGARIPAQCSDGGAPCGGCKKPAAAADEHHHHKVYTVGI